MLFIKRAVVRATEAGHDTGVNFRNIIRVGAVVYYAIVYIKITRVSNVFVIIKILTIGMTIWIDVINRASSSRFN